MKFHKAILLYLLFLFTPAFLNSQTLLVPGYTINNIPVTNTVQQMAVDHAGKRIILTGASNNGKLDIFNINTVSAATISSNWATNLVNCWFPYASTDVEYHNGFMYSCLPSNVSSRDSIVKTNLTNGNSSLIPAPTLSAGLTGIEGGAAFIGNKFYFTSPNASGYIFCLDMNTMAITNYNVNIPLVSYHTLEYNPVDGYLYVSAGNALYKVNLSTPTITTIGNLNSGTFSQFALDPNGLYAWTQDGSTISKMSLATGNSTVIVNSMSGGIYQDLKFGPSTGSCNANGTSLYVGNNANLLELKGFPNTISALSVSTLTYCPGSAFKLPYLAIGNFCAGNVYNAQLSTAAGSFSAPLTIGTLTSSSGADTLFCTLPSTLTAGTGYKVRIVSSLPSVTGFTSAMTLTVIASPVPTISVSGGSICTGQSFTLNPSGAFSYSYSGGNAVISPTATTSYSVIGSSSVGCVSPVPAVAQVTMLSLPSLSVNSGSVCAGGSFTIVPAGAVTYSISGGQFVVTPSVSASYSLSGTSSVGCVSGVPAVCSVTVNPLPVISASSSNSMLCNTQSAVLSASGAATYTWLPSGNGPYILVSPGITTHYTVTGTDANGCVSSDTLTQFVMSCTGIRQLASTSDSWMLYPNPAGNEIQLKCEAPDPAARLWLYDAGGNELSELKMNGADLKVNLSAYARGLYFIRVAGTQNVLLRFVKE
jgi:hypothetical protein